MMTTKPIGLYIHVPFCKSKCRYCDFASYQGALAKFGEDYISALISEISGYKKEEKIPVDTVYFGGGTPSILPVPLLEKVLASARDSFMILPDAEITVEVNPGTVDAEKVLAYKRLGINRVSIGLQSVHENELKILGRIHTFDEFLNAYNLFRDAGFDNVSVDLMYGIPAQTIHSFELTLDRVLALSPEHVSVYGLIVEEGTPFFEMQDKLNLPTLDDECDMYYLAHKKLTSLGYSHYEISNYAKRGRESQHNLKYWRDCEFVGVGLSAYSYLDGKRYGNGRNLADYLRGERILDVVELSREDVMYEYAMMRLRLMSGIDLAEYKDRFGVDFTEGREELIEKYCRLGLAELDSSFRLNEKGFYVSNTILSELL